MHDANWVKTQKKERNQRTPPGRFVKKRDGSGTSEISSQKKKKVGKVDRKDVKGARRGGKIYFGRRCEGRPGHTGQRSSCAEVALPLLNDTLGGGNDQTGGRNLFLLVESFQKGAESFL